MVLPDMVVALLDRLMVLPERVVVFQIWWWLLLDRVGPDMVVVLLDRLMALPDIVVVLLDRLMVLPERVMVLLDRLMVLPDMVVVLLDSLIVLPERVMVYQIRCGGLWGRSSAGVGLTGPAGLSGGRRLHLRHTEQTETGVRGTYVSATTSTRGL